MKIKKLFWDEDFNHLTGLSIMLIVFLVFFLIIISLLTGVFYLSYS